MSPRLRDLVDLLLANSAIAALVALYRSWLPSPNPATISLSFLLVILVVATRGRLWVAVATAFLATGAFNFFFLPPIGTFTVAD
ncbi:MAG TPA: DUF4118 domain-containing protein, partial [Vicinamibacteria bacterium]